jgi:hypothetical protein
LEYFFFFLSIYGWIMLGWDFLHILHQKGLSL